MELGSERVEPYACDSLLIEVLPVRYSSVARDILMARPGGPTR